MCKYDLIRMVFGMLIVGGTFALKFLTTSSDMLVISMAALGGVIIDPGAVLGLMRAYKGRQTTQVTIPDEGPKAP